MCVCSEVHCLQKYIAAAAMALVMKEHGTSHAVKKMALVLDRLQGWPCETHSMSSFGTVAILTPLLTTMQK